jgi:glycosyltransferase involved in cell wall biosynthesis
MPAYNAGRYVEEAVRSILGQTFEDFELIVIDDGSTDETAAVVGRLASADPRVRLLSRPNRGIGATRNELLAMARGRLIAVMDADDVALPDRLRLQVEFLDEHPEVACVGGRTLMIDPGGIPLDEGHLEQGHEELLAMALSGLCPLNHSSLMTRADAVRAVGGYRSEFCPAEDLDLMLRLLPFGRLANLAEVVTRYRLHPKSASERQHRIQIEHSRRAGAEASARLGLPDRFTERAPWRPSDRASRLRFALWFGWRAFEHGDRRAAARYGFGALGIAPWRPECWRLLACLLLKRPRAAGPGGSAPGPTP